MAGISINTKIIFDADTGVAIIEYYSDEVKVGEWTYESGAIHSDEKVGTYDTTFDEMEKRDVKVRLWVSLIASHFEVSSFPQPEYEIRLKRSGTDVNLKVKISGVLVRDDTWVATTGLVSHGPHPEINWTWGEFMVWRTASELFSQAIKDFSKT